MSFCFLSFKNKSVQFYGLRLFYLRFYVAPDNNDCLGMLDAVKQRQYSVNPTTRRCCEHHLVTVGRKTVLLLSPNLEETDGWKLCLQSETGSASQCIWITALWGCGQIQVAECDTFQGIFNVRVSRMFFWVDSDRTPLQQPVPWLPTQPVQLLLDASFTFPENIETFPKEKIEMEYTDITNAK